MRILLRFVEIVRKLRNKYLKILIWFCLSPTRKEISKQFYFSFYKFGGAVFILGGACFR